MKNKETLEEAAERETTFPKMCYPNTASERIAKNNFIKGAKWQQEQDKNKYSEIEVLDLLVGILDANKCFVTFIDIKEWFEQFKNK